jgi:propanol-preferring alcohol dehydrogenase
MVLIKPRQPMELCDTAIPRPGPGQLQLKVSCCGVCRTDLHVVDGELPRPRLPLIPGHQIVGHVTALGEGANGFEPGQRVGVPWLGGSCGECAYCKGGRENLCDDAVYTGYQLNGGFAEYAVADSDYCFALPDDYPDEQAAPLLCAGLIGWRALSMCGEARRIGFYGFGASAHILCQVARWQEREVYAFTRSGDTAGQDFALTLGATWAGASGEQPPKELDAAIIFAPVGALVPTALKAVHKGGVVVCAGIHMSEIPRFSYDLLWGERVVRSVANLTRRDAREFLAIAAKVPVQTEVHPYALPRANDALTDLRHGACTGAAVVTVEERRPE